mmetsp:Transcript_38918/g.120294  ORF Transcript_38918/g.120294 Transcript_38918/m.120294 type:complete len:217 (-) Transcript_38918:79-729(-)
MPWNEAMCRERRWRVPATQVIALSSLSSCESRDSKIEKTTNFAAGSPASVSRTSFAAQSARDEDVDVTCWNALAGVSVPYARTSRYLLPSRMFSRQQTGQRRNKGFSATHSMHESQTKCPQSRRMGAANAQPNLQSSTSGGLRCIAFSSPRSHPGKNGAPLSSRKSAAPAWISLVDFMIKPLPLFTSAPRLRASVAAERWLRRQLLSAASATEGGS